MPCVVHLSSAHPRHDPRIFLKQCAGLAKSGYDVHLVVADGLGAESAQGVRIHDVGVLGGRINRILRTTHRVFSAARNLDADLYHLHDPELIPVGLRLKWLGKKVIFDSHEDVPVQILSKPYLDPRLSIPISRAYALFEHHACARFDGIVAATPFIQDKFLRINPNTIDVCNYPIPGEFEPCVDWDGKRDEICYVGGLSAARGMREIVTSMAQVTTDTRLNLVGGFSEPDLRADLLKTPGWSKVNELGVLDRSGVRDVYRRSRAGLVTLHPLANYVDALPIKMFEYMSAGIPVIASDFPLWRGIIEAADCGICVDPRSPAAIAGAIEALARDPAKARILGQNGRAAMDNRFNWRTEEKKLLSFYALTLSRKDKSLH